MSDETARGPVRRYQRGPHLYKRAGVWYAYAPWCPKGRSLATRRDDEAREKFAAFLAAGPGELQELGRPVEASLVDIAHAWRDAPHGWTRETKRTNKNLVKGWGKWLAKHGVTLSAVLDAWITERQAKVSRRTINRGLRALRRMLGWAADPDRALCDPVAAVANRKYLREPTRSSRAVVPDAAEMGRVLAAFEAHAVALERAHAASPHAKRPDRRAAFERGARLGVATIYGTGLRIAEAQRLTVFDLHDGAVHVRPQAGAANDAEPTKGYRERAIPVVAEVLAVAREFCLWRERARATVGEAWLLRKLDAACTRAGVEPCGLHDLRRAFATNAVRAGVDIVVVAKWLGHARVATTEHYIAAFRSDSRQVAPAPSELLAALRAPDSAVQNQGVISGPSQSVGAVEPVTIRPRIQRRGWDSNPRVEVLQTHNSGEKAKRSREKRATAESGCRKPTRRGGK